MEQGREGLLLPLMPGTALGAKGKVLASTKRTALGFLYRFTGADGGETAILEFCPAGLDLIRQGQDLAIPQGSREAFCRGLAQFWCIGEGLLEARGSQNLPEARDLFEGNGTAYFVQELNRGMPLSALGRRLTEQELLFCTQGLADGLMIAHSLGLVHGEVRLDQICLESAGAVRLTGFFAPCLHRMQNRTLPEPTEDLRAMGESLYRAYTGRPLGRNREGLPSYLASTWERLLLSGGRRGFASVLELQHALTCLCPRGAIQ